MTREVVRILALGGGEALDRTAATLAAEGYAVAQVDDRRRARRLLKAGDFDLVVADGGSRAVSELIADAGAGRPWILLGRADGPVGTPEHALWLAPPVATEVLCERVQTLVAESRKARAAPEVKRASARAAGAARPST